MTHSATQSAIVRRAAPLPNSPSSRALLLAALLWLVMVYLPILDCTLDWDLFHEAALARATLALGYVPQADLFAYTPTITPVVHHEWGTGMILYGILQTLGAPGLVALQYALTFATVACCFATARRRHAVWPLIILGAFVALLLGIGSFTTVRAQLFSVAATAVLLRLLEADRRGNRRWIALFLPLQLLWLNLHGGFVVGLGILGVYWLEQIARTRRPNLHLLATLAAAIALIPLNPFGLAYPMQLLHDLALPRPFIAEWAPLHSDWFRFTTFLVSVLLVAYALRHVGFRRAVGLPLLLIAGVFALRHMRHVSLYAVVFLAYVPAWLTATPRGADVRAFWQRRARILTPVFGVAAVVTLLIALPAQPWRLNIPADPRLQPRAPVLFPVGPMTYMRDQHVVGNVMAPFEVSAYLSYHLHPAVKVAFDSRYEVAYPPERLREILDLYAAGSGWQSTLDRYPPDFLLVPTRSPLHRALADNPVWRPIYHDPAYTLFARPTSPFPRVFRPTVPPAQEP